MSWLNVKQEKTVVPKLQMHSIKTVKVNHSINLTEEQVREAIFDWLKKNGQQFPTNEGVTFICGHRFYYDPMGEYRNDFNCNLTWNSEKVLPV